MEILNKQLNPSLRLSKESIWNTIYEILNQHKDLLKEEDLDILDEMGNIQRGNGIIPSLSLLEKIFNKETLLKLIFENSLKKQNENFIYIPTLNSNEEFQLPSMRTHNRTDIKIIIGTNKYNGCIKCTTKRFNENNVTLDSAMNYLQILNLEEYNTSTQVMINSNDNSITDSLFGYGGIEILNPSKNFVIKSHYDPVRKITGYLHKINDLTAPSHSFYHPIYGNVNSENLIEIGDYGLANKSFTHILMKDALNFQRLGKYALLNNTGIETNTTYMPPTKYEVNEYAFGGPTDSLTKTIVFTSVPEFKYKNGDAADLIFFNNLCGPNTTLYIKDTIYFGRSDNKWITSLQSLYNPIEEEGNILDQIDYTHNRKKSEIVNKFLQKYGDFITVSEVSESLESINGYYKITINSLNSQPNE